MSPEEHETDHDILVGLRKDVSQMRREISDIANGKTANCAAEHERIGSLEREFRDYKDSTMKQIASLWESKASDEKLAALEMARVAGERDVRTDIREKASNRLVLVLFCTIGLGIIGLFITAWIK